jgi:enamine deaminase RidA (YjgF/YER057c/UK114 family)
MTDDHPIDFVRGGGLSGEVPYALAAVAPPGRLVFTAGACPLDRAGVVVGPGDLEIQARQAVTNLFATLQATGVSAGEVLKTTVYVVTTARDDLVRVWTVVKSAFEPFDPPSTLLGVAALGYTHQLVEIEAVALAPAQSGSAPSP